MATVRDIHDYINSFFPFSAQESWDNSGFLVGSPDEEVKISALSLDITADTLKSAKALGAQLMISHHPVIFKAQKSFLAGSLPYELAVSGMSAVCVHTPADAGDGGVNDVLCSILGFENPEKHDFENNGCPVVRTAKTEKTDAPALAQKIASALGAHVRFCDCGKSISTVAVCGGSGCMFLGDVAALGIDAYIVGDAGHHDFLDALHTGISLFAAGHFETEAPCMASLAARLRERFPETRFVELAQDNPCKFAAP